MPSLDNIDFNKKFLSHRLRGYGTYEHTPQALEKACQGNAHYLEIDVRSSKNGRLFVYHNSSAGKDLDQKFKFSATESTLIDKYTFKTGEHLLKYEDAIAIFKKKSRPFQKLCIDIKDAGYEEQYLKCIKDNDLEDRIVFVSWIPQTLLKLNKLNASSPLILSHWNLFKMRTAGYLITEHFRNTLTNIGRYVVIGYERSNADLNEYEVGYQHVILLRELPDDILNILRINQGGICIPHQLLCEAVETYCEKNQLKLWIYSVKRKEKFIKYAKNSYIDVIFCDKIFY